MRTKRRTGRERKPRIAVSYLRCSTQEQAQHGVSIDAQRNACNAYAATLGLTITREFIDDGFSGSSLNRPAMIALRERIRAGEIAAVIFSKLDRASRSLRDTLMLVADCDRYGTELCSAAEALDTSTAMGRAYLHMTGTFSELERGRIAERTAEGLAALRKRGRCYGPVPFGYKRVDDALVPDEPQQAALALMRRMHEQGASLRAIGSALTAAGHKPPKGKAWHPRSVATVLSSRMTQEAAA
jgi:site-specific DNA recombinase